MSKLPAKQVAKTVAKPAALQPKPKLASVQYVPGDMRRAERELVQQHPMYPVFCAAIEQAMWGKGERHGGDVTPFTEQPWAHYARMHGRGFLTGQAAKKLEEAASTRSGQAFEQEVLGAMVYLSMAVLAERGLVGKVDLGGAA